MEIWIIIASLHAITFVWHEIIFNSMNYNYEGKIKHWCCLKAGMSFAIEGVHPIHIYQMNNINSKDKSLKISESAN